MRKRTGFEKTVLIKIKYFPIADNIPIYLQNMLTNLTKYVDFAKFNLYFVNNL